MSQVMGLSVPTKNQEDNLPNEMKAKVWIQQTSWAPGRETEAEEPLLDCGNTLDVWL